MSTPFQNRLVGTVIVAAVVIIFLPDVLDGEKQSHQADFEAIPQAEVFSGKLINKPFPEENLVRQKAISISNEQAIDEVITDYTHGQSPKTAEKLKDKVAVTKPLAKAPVKIPNQLSKTLPEKAVPQEAWVIHLGSFKDKSNVAQLLTKLKSMGYIAFTKPIKTKQGILTKVIIGPELIKSAMVKKLPALKKLTGIQGKVAYFEPIK
ncbi:SPOR domain-containing protein [Colwellia sp. TT2012]|uniref:SPOR domain-containing protein n=1 Tax=Colwellia sp. TT2012 TaxID=1720342 RepID=UPI00070A0E4C|nr:SPOR domain-containing protein [Colwellia sp. TT2012]